MTLEPALRHSRPFFVLLLLIAVLKIICFVSPDHNPEVVHLHETLTSFTIRRLTTVELFAPS